MITEKIKDLFLFIEWLHENTENFKRYNEPMRKALTLKAEYNKITPAKNYKDKKRADELEKEKKEKAAIVFSNVTAKIIAKAKALNVWKPDNSYLENTFNPEIEQLKRDFCESDIPEINKHKSKYIEYRKETNSNYFQDFLFQDLDRILKDLFSFFSDSEIKELGAPEVITTTPEEFSREFKKGNKPILYPDVSIIKPTPEEIALKKRQARKLRAKTKIVALLIQYPKKKIDYCYNKNFNSWLVSESHKKEWIEGQPSEERVFDKQGNVTNVSFSGTTKSGFKLEEQDFIKQELSRIEAIKDIGLLDLDKQKYWEFLKGYFENKAPGQGKTTTPKEFTKNNFDYTEPDTVKAHFQILVKKQFLTEKELTAFLVTAFQNNEPPKEKFTFNRRHYTKKDIRKVFYSYFYDVAGKPHGRQRQYVALLSDYFKGFNTDSLSTNFNK